MRNFALIVAVSLAFTLSPQAQDQQDRKIKPAHKNAGNQQFEIPGVLKDEHEELHKTLEKYTKLPGKTGAAAKAVVKLLHPHIMKEEEYALPLLGLLAELAEGRVPADMKGAIAMSDQLKQQHQQMLVEHKQIVGALQKLKQAASEANNPEVVRFTEALRMHAKTEEQVLYPAAILIGEYLKLKL
jgi:hemerythrin-like domain-containing protein